MVFNI